MKIGIDASRAFQKDRTGIEEYSYQVIKHLVDKLDGHQVVLYTRNVKRETHNDKKFPGDLEIPDGWKVKVINFPRFWTQMGLSWEMLARPVDVLFIPAHTVPIIHPRNTIVTIHGLEYEIMPKAYSFWQRFYMCVSIRSSCRWAKKIIAVSKNTKRDLMELYKVPEDKIEVIYEGVNRETHNVKRETQELSIASGFKPYLLFVGRIEKRKNIEGIIEAYKILKEKYNISHSLVLAGKPGYGYKSIKQQAVSSKYKEEIIETGYITDEGKYSLLKNADVFLFPSFYEGFGLPVLEAQSVGVPVVTSNISSMPEVGGDSVAYCTPSEPVSIADAAYKLISNNEFRDGIIKKGRENVKKFSWDKCAEEIAKLLK